LGDAAESSGNGPTSGGHAANEVARRNKSPSDETLSRLRRQIAETIAA
jgi:hypothetical protein